VHSLLWEGHKADAQQRGGQYLLLTAPLVLKSQVHHLTMIARKSVLHACSMYS
jgi:hypothetical protein